MNSRWLTLALCIACTGYVHADVAIPQSPPADPTPANDEEKEQPQISAASTGDESLTFPPVEKELPVQQDPMLSSREECEEALLKFHRAMVEIEGTDKDATTVDTLHLRRTICLHNIATIPGSIKYTVRLIKNKLFG